MSNLREILKKRILNELYNDVESTHFDTIANRKLKVFMDTLDPIKNIVRAEITSGKSKGLFTVVNLDNLIELNPSKMVAEGESGYYPPGAEFDSRAPWNERDSTDIENTILDDDNQQFHVQLTDGNEIEIDYLDVLEKYWKANPGSFEKHFTEFSHLDDKMDTAVIRKLESENFDFTDYIYQIAETSGKLDSEEDNSNYEFDGDR